MSVLPATRRQAAVTDLLDRLGYIQTAKGYNTDAGLHIFQGHLPKLGPDDPQDCLAVLIGEDTATTAGGRISTRVPFEVWAIVNAAEAADPLASIEAIIADIRAAVEIESPNGIDRYLGSFGDPPQPATLPKGFSRGVTKGTTMPDGAGFVGALVEYVGEFAEVWGEARGGDES